MEQITSRDNKHIKEYSKLAVSKRYRDETSLFVIEGVKLLIETQKSGIYIEKIFVTQECIDKWNLTSEKFFQAPDIYLITKEISKKISLQDTPQGVYAVCRKLDKQLLTDTIYNNGNYLLLCDLQDSGNLGTMLRTAEAMGIDGVIISGGCDIYNMKVIRGSMGSLFRVPTLQIDNVIDFIKDMNFHKVKTYASVVADGQTVGDFKFENPAVLLIGNEGNGLSEEIICACSDRITIKMAGSTESLNAAMAACILMWEMTK